MFFSYCSLFIHNDPDRSIITRTFSRKTNISGFMRHLPHVKELRNICGATTSWETGVRPGGLMLRNLPARISRPVRKSGLFLLLLILVKTGDALKSWEEQSTPMSRRRKTYGKHGNYWSFEEATATAASMTHFCCVWWFSTTALEAK